MSRFGKSLRGFPLLMVLLLLLASWQVPAVSSSLLTGPVTADFTVVDEIENGLVTLVTLKASVPMPDALLEVKTPEGVKAEPQRIELNLGPDQPVQVKILLAASGDGDHRIEFRLSGEAKGYEKAGISQRRYLSVREGESRLMTGVDLRRELRAEVARKLQKDREKDPDGGYTLDTYLVGNLQTLPTVDQVKVRIPDLTLTNRNPLLAQQESAETPKMTLAPPATGMEPYDDMGVVDHSADVIRALDPITVTGRLYYVGRDGVQHPFVNATVDIRDDDIGPDEQLTSVITNWNGDFSATVNNSDGWLQNGRDIYVRVRATNGRFRVQDCSYAPDWTYSWRTETRNDLSDGTVVNFGSMVLADYQEAAILFQDLNQGWNYLTATGHQDPGFVDLCFPEGASQYSTFWEEVDIEDGDEVARDIVLHEYGHATMHNAYDGYWPSNTGGAHTFNSILHQNMAFTEGWATFVALAVNPDGVYDSNGWSRSIEAFSHSSGHTAGDGKRNEGHVAAGLGDIHDSSSDGNCATGDCDPSGPDSALFSTIWRDAFWLSKADDVDEYWNTLCIDLTEDQRAAAVRALAYNEIDVANCSCSAEAAFAGEPDAQEALSVLREFRDRELRGTEFGVRVADLYYKHSTEVGVMMLEDKELRKMGLELFRTAAKAHKLLQKGDMEEILLDARHAKLTREFMAKVQEQGSDSLRKDFDLLRPLVDAFEGKRAAEVRAKIEFLNQKP